MTTRIYSFTFFFFFNDTATTEIYTLSLHDALPISTPPARGGLVTWRIWEGPGASCRVHPGLTGSVGAATRGGTAGCASHGGKDAFQGGYFAWSWLEGQARPGPARPAGHDRGGGHIRSSQPGAHRD